ncbi:hypothetical protein ALC57_02415, partial [Trachymyrmex cornetzi]
LHVWVGICNGEVIGPYFFERTINSPMYLEFLENDLPAYLENVPFTVRLNLWYQQDGAPAHYARIIRMYLNQRFPNRLGHYSTLPSLAESPLDLAFTGWVTTRLCLHWLGHHTTLSSLAGSDTFPRGCRTL